METTKIFKAVFLAALICLGYLFALNGRYTEVDDARVVFDKWTETFLWFRGGSVTHVK